MTEPSALVRVRDKATGHEFTIARRLFNEDAQVELKDKDPLGPSGEPAPVLYRTPLGKPRPGSKADIRREQAQQDQEDGHESADDHKED